MQLGQSDKNILRAACRGHDPKLFTNADDTIHALVICDTCPVRSWCLRFVDPARSYFDGVAGGHTWFNGQLKCRSCLKTDPALIAYMKPIGRHKPSSKNP